MIPLPRPEAVVNLAYAPARDAPVPRTSHIVAQGAADEEDV